MATTRALGSKDSNRPLGTEGTMEPKEAANQTDGLAFSPGQMPEGLLVDT